MPIHYPVTLACLSAEEFEKIDFRVMGHAYASQNALGRLCDESAYQADLAARLLGDGLRFVHTEVPVTVTHRDFSKQYFLDLVVENALYELKARNAFTGEDETQLLNYMFLLGIQRGKLVNFRPPKVQGKIISTSLTQAERRRFTENTLRWSELAPACAILRRTVLACGGKGPSPGMKPHSLSPLQILSFPIHYSKSKTRSQGKEVGDS